MTKAGKSILITVDYDEKTEQTAKSLFALYSQSTGFDTVLLET
jgi:hypothetical protein